MMKYLRGLVISFGSGLGLFGGGGDGRGSGRSSSSWCSRNLCRGSLSTTIVISSWLGGRESNLDDQLSLIHHHLLRLGQGSLLICLVGELNETESLGALVPVLDNVGLGDL